MTELVLAINRLSFLLKLHQPLTPWMPRLVWLRPTRERLLQALSAVNGRCGDLVYDRRCF